MTDPKIDEPATATDVIGLPDGTLTIIDEVAGNSIVQRSHAAALLAALLKQAGAVKIELAMGEHSMIPHFRGVNRNAAGLSRGESGKYWLIPAQEEGRK